MTTTEMINDKRLIRGFVNIRMIVGEGGRPASSVTAGSTVARSSNVGGPPPDVARGGSWGRTVCVLRFVAAGCLILAAKLLLIRHCGSVVPYWDQWDGIAYNLLLPWEQGRLGLADLFAAHNEHRIVFTRVISLWL